MNLAMFGGFGKVPPPSGWRRQTAVAVLGGGDGAQLTAIAFLGGIDVKVPEGARVSMSGLSLLGGRDVKVEPGDGPTIRIRAVAVLGGVSVATRSAQAALG